MVKQKQRWLHRVRWDRWAEGSNFIELRYTEKPPFKFPLTS
jgi:hypothetical protein